MTTQLRRALGFRDLVLFMIGTTFSLRWIATAAAAGPSALVIWLIAAGGLFVPLAFTALELSTRYPDEGGIYVWSKRAFGPFAAFMTGWTYWAANLPYYPGLLYFAAGNLLFVGGDSWQALGTNQWYFIATSLIGLTVALVLNIVGLNVGKWLTNAGTLAIWVPLALLFAFGLTSWARAGAATPITLASLRPDTGLKDVIFWSTIAFAFGGLEGGLTMGEEIVDARRTVPRAIATAGLFIVFFYIAGTLCVLLALPKEQVSGLQGVMQAIQTMSRQAGVPWLVPFLAALVTLNAMGGLGGWFAATARLPFVAGIDRFLPPIFGVLHPRWRTPYVAMLVQAVIAAVFALLGQAGTSVRGAYEVLVSMGIITYFIPYLFMFAAMVRLQREPAGPDVIRVPGGAPVARVLGALGFLVSAASIVLASIPAADEADKTLAVVKVVGSSIALVLIGVAIYFAGRQKPAQELRPA
jgi:glutamate:GABA antiporter